LRLRDYHLSTHTIGNHLKRLHAKSVNLRIKPTLTPQQKEARMRFIWTWLTVAMV
jgi:hypothetical protein